jgi:hypothetical protein
MEGAGKGRQGKRCTGNKEARLEQRKKGRIAKEEGFSLLTFHVSRLTSDV